MRSSLIDRWLCVFRIGFPMNIVAAAEMQSNGHRVARSVVWLIEGTSRWSGSRSEGIVSAMNIVAHSQRSKVFDRSVSKTK